MANCLYCGSNIPIELTLGQLLIYVTNLTYSISYYKIKINLLVVINYIFIVPIELPKAIREYKTNKENGALQWMMFLENPEDVEVTKIMEENENIKEAKEELDRISQDDILRRMAFKAELERMDHAQLMYEAKRDGKKEGIIEGAKEERLQIAKNMLKEGANIEFIIRVTGLTKEEIEKLK